MIKKEPNTDKAWNALYSKLEAENLLNDKSAVGRGKKEFHIQWVAACIALIVSTTFFFYQSDRRKEDIITLQNLSVDDVLVKTLDDGSIIYLAGNASLNYPTVFSSNQRTVELKGEALFDIAKNPAKPFVIETKKVTVKVLGTAFKIKSYDDTHFDLAVQRGRVRVTEKETGTTVIVTAGQSVACIGNRLFKYQNVGQPFERYMTKMRFKDEKLEDIVHVINQNNKSYVVLKNEELKDRRLNVEFYKNDVEEMTQIISLALNLKREVKQDTIYISHL